MKKWGVELQVMKARLRSEGKLKEPIDDEYGMDCINAMIVDINKQYAVKVDDAEDGGNVSEGF
jgi:hypothetical protein